MAKIDVTVSRKMTINTGNYSSITPSVSLTAKDVNTENISKAYDELDVIITGLMSTEIRNLSEVQGIIKQNSLASFLEFVEEKEKDMFKDMEESIKELEKL